MIKMDALRAMYAGLGFENIQTYIQSGNVVFGCHSNQLSAVSNQPHATPFLLADAELRGADTEAIMGKLISQKILEVFGFEVPVMVMGVEELVDVIRNNPFVGDRNEDVSKLHVTFLSSVPDLSLVEKISGGMYGGDEFIVVGRVVYLLCPNGYGNTKLNNAFFESKLKVVATTRNWKTINELVRIGGLIN